MRTKKGVKISPQIWLLLYRIVSETSRGGENGGWIGVGATRWVALERVVGLARARQRLAPTPTKRLATVGTRHAVPLHHIAKRPNKKRPPTPFVVWGFINCMAYGLAVSDIRHKTNFRILQLHILDILDGYEVRDPNMSQKDTVHRTPSFLPFFQTSKSLPQVSSSRCYCENSVNPSKSQGDRRSL